MALLLLQQKAIEKQQKHPHPKIITDVKFQPEKDMFSFFTDNDCQPEFWIKRIENGEYACSMPKAGTWQRMSYTNGDNREDGHQTHGFLWYEKSYNAPRFLDLMNINLCGCVVCVAVGDDVNLDRAIYLSKNNDIDQAFLKALGDARQQWNLDAIW